MYAWIWRQLPFGLPGKLTGSLLLFAGAVSLLWFWIFPATAEWVENVLLPFDQSTIGDGDWQDPAGTPGGSDPGLDDEELPDDPHAIPYETDG